MNFEEIGKELYLFMKEKCSKLQHSGEAIYYCVNEVCNNDDRYLCSECMMDNPTHFSSHIKTLVPLDDETKFFKACDFLKQNKTIKINEIISDDKNLIANRNKLEKYYKDLKELISQLIDEHMKENLEKYCSAVENKTGPNNVEEKINLISKEVNNRVYNFQSDKNNKREFYKLLAELNKQANELEQITQNKPSNNYEIDIQINRTSLMQKLTDIIEENIQEARVPHKATLTKTHSKGSNFTFGIEEISDSSNIQANDTQTLNSSRGSTSLKNKEELINSYMNESVQHDDSRSENIKSRLELLKQKMKNDK
jgi:hypothetical protein